MAESLLTELPLRDRARKRVLPDELRDQDIINLCFPTYNELKAKSKQEHRDYDKRRIKFKELLEKSIKENTIQARHEEVKTKATNFRGEYSSPHTVIFYYNYINCDNFLKWIEETKLWDVTDKDALIWGWWKDNNYPDDFEKPQSVKPHRSKKSDEENTLKALGGLAIIISNMAGIYKKSDSPNAKQIQEAILDYVKNRGIDTYGFSTAIRNKITAGVELFLDEASKEVPQDKKR